MSGLILLFYKDCMNRGSIIPLSLIVYAIFLLSCRGTSAGFSRIEYTVPGHINISKVDLEIAFRTLKTDPSSPYYIEIILYSYSSGAESIAFSGSGDVVSSTKNGRVKGLVRLMNGKKTVKAVFIKGEGKTREEIISSLVNDATVKLDN